MAKKKKDVLGQLNEKLTGGDLSKKRDGRKRESNKENDSRQRGSGSDDDKR